METGVFVAIIAAAGSLVVAFVNAAISQRNVRKSRDESRRLAEEQGDLQRNLTLLKADLDRKAKFEEREQTAKSELERAREPLLAAAVDLGDRLHNIRRGSFLAYLSTGGRRAEMTRLGTLYRFARYWCIVEALYDRVALLQFREDETTRPVAATLRAIGRTCASDTYDGGKFMMWREEQRAIAEKMHADSPAGCIGYATFVERYDEVFSSWFSSFDADLEPASAAGSERFKELQGQLAELARQLDIKEMYKEQWLRSMQGV